MAGKTYFERRCVRLALETYLAAIGWHGITFKEGFGSEDTIVVPTVSVEFIAPKKKSLELGQNKSGNKVYIRSLQFDCYMQTEKHAIDITDDIMDFIDEVPIQIVNNDSTPLGSLINYDTDTIDADVLDPILSDPRLKHWRGVVKGVYEAFYPAN